MEMQVNKNNISTNSSFCHLGSCIVIMVPPLFTEKNAVLMKILAWKLQWGGHLQEKASTEAPDGMYSTSLAIQEHVLVLALG